MIMNNNPSSRTCCTYAKQIMLILLFLSFFVTFYSLDQTILSIGSHNNNITAINGKDTLSTSCVDLCTAPYYNAFGDAECCANISNFDTCKGKQECKLEIITNIQNELNSQYLYLLLESGLLLFIIIVFAVYCVRKRLAQARRMRQAEENQRERENDHAALFNYVGSLMIRQDFQPASLQQSFLFNEGNESSCSICLESLLQAKAIRLKCEHYFHSQCIKSWMQTKNTCPICRTKN